MKTDDTFMKKLNEYNVLEQHSMFRFFHFRGPILFGDAFFSSSQMAVEKYLLTYEDIQGNLIV